MNDLTVHPAAQAEYEIAAHWYAERSVVAADRFCSEVEAGIAAIRCDPNTFPRLDETHRTYLLNRFPYYIAYRQRGRTIEIVAIRHLSRDQDAWKSR